MANTIGQVAALVGLSLLGSLTRRRREQRAVGFDEQPTTVATRGSYVPVVVGRQRVAPVALYAGDRITTGGGGGGKGGGGGARSLIYHEAGWHGLCVGPATKLHGIFVDNKPIYSGPIEASVATSGTAIQSAAPHPGAGFIYWGETDQPVNTRLAEGTGTGSAGVGVASRWPRLTYVEWRRIQIGESPIWPNLEYEIEVRHTAPLSAAPAWIGESSAGAGDDGNNPMHALWSLLTAPHPAGCGVPCSSLSCACFNYLAEIFADERIAVNFIVPGGAEGVQAVADLLIDLGVVMPDLSGKLAPRALRQATQAQIDASPIIDADAYAALSGRIVRDHALPLTRSVYAFGDRKLNYREQPLVRDDDAAADIAGAPIPRRVRISSASNAVVAGKIADRRSDEDLSPRSLVRIEAARGAAALAPGDLFRLRAQGEAERVCVVSSIRRKVGAPDAEISAFRLRYGLLAQGAGPPPPPSGPGAQPPLADILFEPQELPWSITRPTETPRLGVLRVRQGVTGVGADILGSNSATSGFSVLARETGFCFGGTLTATLAPGRSIIGLAGDGPVIETYNEDIADAEDLRASTLRNDWLSGRQPCLIGVGPDAEIAFVRAVIPVTATQYRLDGVIRARMDTGQKSWPSGTPILFFGSPTFRRVVSIAAPSLLVPGVTAHIKSVPFNSSGSVDPATVTARAIAVAGRASRPLPVFNLRANGKPDTLATFSSGSDVRLTWHYRVRDGLGSAAGEQAAGSPIGPKPGRDGPFRVEIWSGGPATLKRTIPLESDDTSSASGGVLYTSAQINADHGGSPPSSFQARVTCARGAYRSLDRTITLTLV